MPQLISPTLSAQITRRTKEYAFTDFGYYIPQADLTTLDEYGQPTASTERVPVSCSFNDKPSMETWRGNADVQQVEAEVRLTSPVPTKGGRFVINRRFDEHVTEKTFEIVGIQDRGAFGFVCALKAVAI